MPEGQEFVAMLESEHDKLETIVSRLEATDDLELVDYFCQLREELLGHESAEALVVYPVFRRNVPGGNNAADACLAEQSELEQSLARLERYQDDPVVLRACLLQLGRMLRDHACHEELEIFPTLVSRTKPKELQELARRYQAALGSRSKTLASAVLAGL